MTIAPEPCFDQLMPSDRGCSTKSRCIMPDWLSSPHQLRGGTSGAPYDKMENLPQKLDAIIYIDRTTPSSSFW